MTEQLEPDFRDIDRARDLPPDEMKPSLWDERDDEPYDHQEEDDDA